MKCYPDIKMLVRGFTLENYYKIKSDRITNRRKNKKLSEPSLNIVAFSFILSPEFDNIYSLYYFPFFLSYHLRMHSLISLNPMVWFYLLKKPIISGTMYILTLFLVSFSKRHVFEIALYFIHSFVALHCRTIWQFIHSTVMDIWVVFCFWQLETICC